VLTRLLAGSRQVTICEPFIQRLRGIKRLLCAKTEQAIRVPL
jgi:hypothetical protein